MFRSADGSRYFGSWKNGKRDGFGIEIGEDGTYTGEWLNNSHHGWGTMQFGASLNRYTGEWKYDTMEGVGSMVWVTLKDQNRAKKLWRRASSKMLLGLAAEREHRLGRNSNSLMNNNNNNTGNATDATNNNNNNGNLNLSRRNSLIGGVTAKSLLLSSDDMQQYVGEWKNGCPDGNGELRRILLSTSKSSANSLAAAEKKNSSHRSVPFEMGNHFQGTFKRGKRDGFGIQYFADGSAFEGTWQQNLKHGKGTMIRSDGTLVHVTLQNDTLVSEKTLRQQEAEQQQQLELLLKNAENNNNNNNNSNSTSLNNTQRTNQSATTNQQQQNNINSNTKNKRTLSTTTTSVGTRANQSSSSTAADFSYASTAQHHNDVNPNDTSNLSSVPNIQPNDQSQPPSHQDFSSSAPTTHVDISVKDICFSKNDERAVHITISLVFVALRHLFHVYVGMQSGCGNFDDIYSAQIHSKLPEGIQKRSKVQQPKFVSAMSDEVLRATPIHHLSDFDGTVQLAEAHGETTLLSAAKAAQRAMRTVMIHEYRVKKYAAFYHQQALQQQQQQSGKIGNSNTMSNVSRRSNSPLSINIDERFGEFFSSDQQQQQEQLILRPELSPPLSPVAHHGHGQNHNNAVGGAAVVVGNGSMSPSQNDIMSKFLSWTNVSADDDDDDDADGKEGNNNARNVSAEVSQITINNHNNNNKQRSASGSSHNYSSNNNRDQDDNETIAGANASTAILGEIDNQPSQRQRRPTLATNSATNNANRGTTRSSLVNDDHDEEEQQQNENRHASIEELFGQYNATTNSASVAGTNTATGSAERRPLSTVMHLAGFISLLRDAEILSPDMTALDVLDCLEPLLSRRAHVPGSPGLTWPAFVEAIVRVAHKKLALSAVFCAQDQLAGASLGSRLHHFVKEYLHPLLRCIKDLEACPEASAIIGVEQLEIATSENTTFESLRKATLRQLRAMTTSTGASTSSHLLNRRGTAAAGGNNVTTNVSATTNNKQKQLRSASTLLSTGALAGNDSRHQSGADLAAGTSDSASGAALFADNQILAAFNTSNLNNEMLDDLNTLSSGENTPRSISDTSLFDGGVGAGSTSAQLAAVSYQQHQLQLQQQQSSSTSSLPSTFDEAILLLAKQVEETIHVKKQINNSNPSSSSVSQIQNYSHHSQLQQQNVVKGMELLQALCAGSWSQFPGVAQCEVIEKVRIQALQKKFTDDDNDHRNKQSPAVDAPAVFASDFVEVWCVATRPHRSSPQIRLHLLLVQIVKQTSEVRFVGFVPSATVERLCVQSKRDASFFETLTKRTLFMAVPSKTQRSKRRDSLRQQMILPSQNHHRRTSSASNAVLLARNASSVSQGSRKSITSSSSTGTGSKQNQQHSIAPPDLSVFVAASASHQLIRGSRFFSTAPLIYFDSIKRLYLSCDKSLGPLVAACTFSGLFLYPGQKSNKKTPSTSSSSSSSSGNNTTAVAPQPFPVSSIDVLRHCMHALYGIDPVTSTGGLFIDIKSNYTGYLSAGRKSIAGTTHSKQSTSLGNGSNNNNDTQHAIVDNADVLISPDEAASVVMQALQTLSRNTKSSPSFDVAVSGNGVGGGVASTTAATTTKVISNKRNAVQNTSSTTATSSSVAMVVQTSSTPTTSIEESISQQNNAKRFAEISEAVKARAQQAIKSEEQRLLYHGDNWRAREQNRKQRGFDQLSSWPLAASDLKLSFGEFVECIMIICGLCTNFQQEQQQQLESSSFVHNNHGEPNSATMKPSHHQNSNQFDASATPPSSNPDQQNVIFTPPSFADDNDALGMTSADIFTRSMIDREEKEMNSALQGVMRASRAAVGTTFANSIKNNDNNNLMISTSHSNKPSFINNSSNQSQTRQEQLNIGETRTVACSTFLLDGFLKSFLPTIQYFVEARCALPKLVPSYWSWAIIDSYHHSPQQQQQQQAQFDSLRTTFVSNSLKKRAVSAGLFADANRREMLIKLQKRREQEQQEEKEEAVRVQNEQQYFLGRPLSPISFVNDSKDSAEQKIAFQKSRNQQLPPYTTRESVERQQKLQKSTEITPIEINKILWSEEDILAAQEQQQQQLLINNNNNGNVDANGSASRRRTSSSVSRRRSVSVEQQKLKQGSAHHENNINMANEETSKQTQAIINTSHGLDDTKVAEILDKIDAQKKRDADVVDKLQLFHNKRYDEAERTLQKREAAERARQEMLLLASSSQSAKGRHTSASRRGRRPTSPSSPNSRTGSSSSRPTSPNQLQLQNQNNNSSPSSRTSSSSHHQNSNQQQQEPSRGQQLLLAKKKKGFVSPKMAMVTNRIVVGTSSIDGSDGLMVKTVENEIIERRLAAACSSSTSSSNKSPFVIDSKTGVRFEVVDGGKRIVDDHRTDNPDKDEPGYFYDDRLNRRVTHPSDLQQVVKKGLLLETPPITFTIKRIEEDLRPDDQNNKDGDRENDSSPKKKNVSGSKKPGTSSARRKSVSPVMNSNKSLRK